MQAAHARATWRLVLAEIAHAYAGQSSRALAAALPAMLRRGQVALPDGRTLTVPPCPSLRPGETLADPGVAERVAPSARWLLLARQKARPALSVGAFLDRPRSGRPAAALPAVVAQAIDRALLLPGGASQAECLRDARAAARAAGLPEPSRAVVRRAYLTTPPERRAAGRHGKHAAIADATPKGALPWRQPGECYVLDETRLPIWVRVWVASQQTYVALKPWACFVIDAASEVIVGYHIAMPLFGNETRSISGVDIFGAFASAIFPDLSTPACRPYVGRLPKVMRCDNVKSHRLVNERAALAGIDVSHNPVYKPWANAAIETLNGILKPLCRTLKGYDQHWKVAEYEREDSVAKRRQLAATESRLPPHMAIRIEDLLDVASLRQAFDAIVQAYNETLVHSRWRMARRDRFMERVRPEAFQPWQCGFAMLDATQVHVREHIEVRRVAFSAQSVEGGVRAWGSPVLLHLDPLLRVAWEVPRDPAQPVATFLPAKEMAQRAVPADVVRQQEAAAQAASDAAREARYAYQADVLGSHAAADLANAVAAPPSRGKKGARRPAATTPTPAVPGARARRGRRPPSIVTPSAPGQLGFELGPPVTPSEAPPPTVPPTAATPTVATRTAPATPAPPATPVTPAAPVPLPVLQVLPGGAGVALPRGLARRPSALTLVAPRAVPMAAPTTAVPTDSTTPPAPTEATA